MELKEFLINLASGAFSVVLVREIVRYGLVEPTAKNKNILAVVLPTVLVVLGHFGLWYFGYATPPVTAEDWLSTAITILTSAYGSGQLIYKFLAKPLYTKLSKEDKIITL